MKDITQSELFAVMTCGFASIAGALLGALSAYGVRSLLLFWNSPGSGESGDGGVLCFSLRLSECFCHFQLLCLCLCVYVSALASKNSFFLDTVYLCRCGDETEDELYRLCALVLMHTFQHLPTKSTCAKVTTSKILRNTFPTSSPRAITALENRLASSTVIAGGGRRWRRTLIRNLYETFNLCSWHRRKRGRVPILP